MIKNDLKERKSEPNSFFFFVIKSKRSESYISWKASRKDNSAFAHVIKPTHRVSEILNICNISIF